VDDRRVRELAARAGLTLDDADAAEVAVRLDTLLAELGTLPADLPPPDNAFEPVER
jgi:hypothetical protein